MNFKNCLPIDLQGNKVGTPNVRMHVREVIIITLKKKITK